MSVCFSQMTYKQLWPISVLIIRCWCHAYIDVFCWQHNLLCFSLLWTLVVLNDSNKYFCIYLHRCINTVCVKLKPQIVAGRVYIVTLLLWTCCCAPYKKKVLCRCDTDTSIVSDDNTMVIQYKARHSMINIFMYQYIYTILQGTWNNTII